MAHRNIVRNFKPTDEQLVHIVLALTKKMDANRRDILSMLPVTRANRSERSLVAYLIDTFIESATLIDQIAPPSNWTQSTDLKYEPETIQRLNRYIERASNVKLAARDQITTRVWSNGAVTQHKGVSSPNHHLPIVLYKGFQGINIGTWPHEEDGNGFIFCTEEQADDIRMLIVDTVGRAIASETEM